MTLFSGIEPGVMTLTTHHEGQLEILIAKFPIGVLDGGDLMVDAILKLALGDTITVEQHVRGPSQWIVCVSPGIESFFHHAFQVLMLDIL